MAKIIMRKEVPLRPETLFLKHSQDMSSPKVSMISLREYYSGIENISSIIGTAASAKMIKYETGIPRHKNAIPPFTMNMAFLL